MGASAGHPSLYPPEYNVSALKSNHANAVRDVHASYVMTSEVDYSEGSTYDELCAAEDSQHLLLDIAPQ